jgi:hypothetical protein
VQERQPETQEGSAGDRAAARVPAAEDDESPGMFDAAALSPNGRSRSVDDVAGEVAS